MFKRGQVVQHTETNWIGVVTLDGADGLIVKWFEGRNGGGLVDRTLVMPIDGYAFEAALALGDTATALRLYREAQAGADPNRFYVYRKDAYEPGGLEYWKAFETVDEAKAEIENGLMYDEMRVVCAHQNVLSEILDYTRGWNADYTEAICTWQTREQTPRQPVDPRPTTHFSPEAVYYQQRTEQLEAALEPFAAYGRLKLRYPANAVFTIAYDREGREVILLFEDFTRAAEVHPNAVGRTRATTAQGGAGGIAEIAVGATEMTHDQRIAIANRDIEGYLRAAGQWVESDREYRVRYVTADGETCYARVHTASAEKAAALVRDAIRTATAIEVLTPDEVTS